MTLIMGCVMLRRVKSRNFRREDVKSGGLLEVWVCEDL